MRRTLFALLACAPLALAGCQSGPHLSHAAAMVPSDRPESTWDPGPTWRLHAKQGHGIAGYADTTSVTPGTTVHLYVSTAASTFDVHVFRMGWYGGRKGHQFRVLSKVRGHVQPHAALVQPRHTVVARWQRSASLDTRRLLPGHYLLRLDASDGSQSYIPLTLRSPSVRGKVVLVSPVTSWQAYNAYGGYNLYKGPDGRFATRSRAVSFDRPYKEHEGSSEFIRRELPVLSEAERLGLPLAFLTDIDLDRNSRALDGARAVITMGHDEYWSAAMRRVATAARDHGTNVAFFGANGMYRRIRFESSALGAARVQVDYKVASEDPYLGVHNDLITADWPAPPRAQPESAVIGSQYECFKHTWTPAVVVAPTSPFFAGTGVKAGTQLPGVMGPEIDRVRRSYPTPRPLQILMHSPFPCPGHGSFGDTTYYTAKSGAGVFAAGSETWVCAMTTTCVSSSTAAIITKITDNVLRLFARGPAARYVPAQDNVAKYGGR